MKKIVVSLLVAIAAIAGTQKSEAAEITVSYGGYTAMDACGYYKDNWHSVNTACMPLMRPYIFLWQKT